MELIFHGGGEVLKFKIDRPTKSLSVISSNTHYQEKKVPWHYLFDKGKEISQEAITDKLNDEEFIQAITHSMTIFGYQRKMVTP